MDLPDHRKLVINDVEILVNELTNYADKTLEEITQSEEFNRGLSIIASGKDSLEDVVNSILLSQKTFNHETIALNSLIAFCNY